MTSDQFDALAELLRLRSGPAEEAARLVLVDGLSVPEAARTLGVEYQIAYKAVQRAQQGLELVQRVVAGSGVRE